MKRPLLLDVQIERLLVHSTELSQADFAEFCNLSANSLNRLMGTASQFCRLFGLVIEAKKTDYLSYFTLRNVRNFCVLVFRCPTVTYRDNNLLELS